VPVGDLRGGAAACGISIHRQIEAGNVRRNSLIGPKLVDADFSVYKNFPIRKISETFRVQFGAEMFNILNHANFAPHTSRHKARRPR
jgi:hypothetical protein